MSEPKRAGVVSEFRDFLLKQNALALAVGVVIGAAFGKVVGGVVDDLIMPVVALLTPGGDWRSAGLEIGTSAKGESVKLLFGDLAGRLLDFAIVAAVVFGVTRMFLKEAKAEAAPTTKACPRCLEMVPMAATRCRACTSDL